jgi:hypothetical protein
MGGIFYFSSFQKRRVGKCLLILDLHVFKINSLQFFTLIGFDAYLLKVKSTDDRANQYKYYITGMYYFSV